jgi:hypothetical protein
MLAFRVWEPIDIDNDMRGGFFRRDHICYIWDLSKVRQPFPTWRIRHEAVPSIEDIVREHHDAKSPAFALLASTQCKRRFS